MSTADRAWWAYHCLPRDKNGEPPTVKQFEKDNGLYNGLLGKIFSGERPNPTLGVVKKIAKALKVSVAFLNGESDEWPKPTGEVPPRKVTHEGTTRLPQPRYEVTEEFPDGSGEIDTHSRSARGQERVESLRVADSKALADTVIDRLQVERGWKLPRAAAAVHLVRLSSGMNEDALFYAAIVKDYEELGGTPPPRTAMGFVEGGTEKGAKSRKTGR